MGNLELYDKVRAVPDNAKKTIGAGRLKGMTDINPMWRIKCLTENFGICGIGWKTQIVRTWIDVGYGGEAITNVEILLFVKVDGAWSEGIPGVGGSRFIAKETGGLYTDDECYKKAYTDAISVACKALGIGADVYWDADRTKYDGNQDGRPTPPPTQKKAQPQNAPKPPQERREKSQWAEVNELIKNSDITLASVTDWIVKKFGANIKINNLTKEQFAQLITALKAKVGEEAQ